MKQQIKLFLFLVSSLIANTSFAIDICETHEICYPGSQCECRVSAESSYNRSFYADFQEIKKGHVYKCTFNETNNSHSSLLISLNESNLPDGSKVQCEDSCSHFPATFSLDTNEMKNNDKEVAIFKYIAPPSDIPHDVTANCEM